MQIGISGQSIRTKGGTHVLGKNCNLRAQNAPEKMVHPTGFEPVTSAFGGLILPLKDKRYSGISTT